MFAPLRLVVIVALQIIVVEGVALSHSTGLNVPPDLNDRIIAEGNISTFAGSIYGNQYLSPTVCDPNSKRCDYRHFLGRFPSIDQEQCQSCYVMATITAFNASTRLRFREQRLASPQLPLNAISSLFNYDGCSGGYWDDVLNFLRFNSDVTIDTLSYSDSADQTYTGNPQPRVFQISDWGYVPGTGSQPAKGLIKEYLTRYGPLITGMSYTGSSAFDQYHRGVYREMVPPNSPINHAVVIFGWDDDRRAWLIRNSWERSWGFDDNYAWIGYDSNRIGVLTAYLIPRKPPASLDKVPISLATASANRSATTQDQLPIRGHGETDGIVAVGPYSYVKFYVVRDHHSTGIHVRNIGRGPLYVTLSPSCDDASHCPSLSSAKVPPVRDQHDGGNDYIYTAATLSTVHFDWIVDDKPTPLASP